MRACTEVGGVEPPRGLSASADFKSAAFPVRSTPPTNRKWNGPARIRTGTHRDPKSPVLPLHYGASETETEGLEPPRPCGRLISNQRPYQLGYVSKEAGEGNRTPDPRLTRTVLCLLSYSGGWLHEWAGWGSNPRP